MSEYHLYQLSVLLGQKLLQQGLWITCAESCTGGWVAKTITDIAGSSAWFDRGFVTYSNVAKQQMLGVEETTLQQYGAVSEQVALAMAEGALTAAQADIAIAISGIAGPAGGTADKPVGTVCFAFTSRQQASTTCTHRFSGNRTTVRLQSTIFAIKTVCEQFLQK